MDKAGSADRVSIDGLQGCALTLLVPLTIKALEARRRDAIVRDPRAIELVQKLDFNFSTIKIPKITHITATMRAKQFDEWTRIFLAAHPRAEVVEIGCGLDARFERVDNGTVQWYDFDLPEVIGLREKPLSKDTRHRHIARSVLFFDWMGEVQVKDASDLLLVAEGVLMYLDLQDVKRLFLQVQERFPRCQIIFDACKPFVARLSKHHPSLGESRPRMKWGVSDGYDVEKWNDGIRLIEQWTYFDHGEPRLGFCRALRWIPFINSMFRLYRFGFHSNLCSEDS